MSLPFTPAKAGDTISLEGVILRDFDSLAEYHLYFPQSVGDTQHWVDLTNQILAPEDWAEWLKNSDDPTFTEYTDESRKVIKAIVRKGTRQFDQEIVWATYRRDNFTCVYCGAKDRPLTYDHYLAQAFGGLWTLENGRTACRPCNKKKANKTIAEWETYLKEKNESQKSNV